MISFLGKLFTSLAIGVSGFFGIHAEVPMVAPSASTTPQQILVPELGNTSGQKAAVPATTVTSKTPISSPAQTPIQTPIATSSQSGAQSQQEENSSSTKELLERPIPAVKVTANPATVEYGGTSVIGWVATNALSCTLGSSPVLLAVAGSQSVSPNNSDWSKSSKITYTITCTGAGGSASGEATVTVQSWVPSAECKTAAEETPTVKGYELNPELCSKLTM